MSETSVSFDLLQTFQILTQFVLQSVGQDLRVLSVLHVLRSVQEVVRDLVLTGVLHDGDKSFDFFIGQFTGTFVHIDVGLLQTDVGESSTNSLDGRHGVHDLRLTVDVGVHHTKDVLELGGYHERHLGGWFLWLLNISDYPRLGCEGLQLCLPLSLPS